MDTKQKLDGIVMTKTITISPDEDAKKAGEKKTIVLKMDYDGLTVEDILLKALDKDVISWQNGSGGRRNYDNLTNNQVVKVKASAPGKAPQVDPKVAYENEFNAMTPEEQKAEIDRLLGLTKKQL